MNPLGMLLPVDLRFYLYIKSSGHAENYKVVFQIIPDLSCRF